MTDRSLYVVIDRCGSLNVSLCCVVNACVCVSRSHDAGSVSFPSDSEAPSGRRSSFLWRVLWVALPLQLFLLLLVVFAFLLPMTEEDYCAQSNNFAHSFYPMLSYTNGPPPVQAGCKSISSQYSYISMTRSGITLTSFERSTMSGAKTDLGHPFVLQKNAAIYN